MDRNGHCKNKFNKLYLLNKTSFHQTKFIYMVDASLTLLFSRSKCVGNHFLATSETKIRLIFHRTLLILVFRTQTHHQLRFRTTFSNYGFVVTNSKRELSTYFDLNILLTITLSTCYSKFLSYFFVLTKKKLAKRVG